MILRSGLFPASRLPLSLLALLVVALAEPAHAQKPDIAIVAAASSNGKKHIKFRDPRLKLKATGYFNSIDVFDAELATPRLSALMDYDAILVWSSVSFKDSSRLGDRMADFVDAGGGVVVAVFANTTTTPERFLEGRWITGNYEVIQAQGGQKTGQAFLGTILEPSHPTMAGVQSFDGGVDSYRPSTNALTPGSRVIAEWDDGSPLVVVSDTFGGRVDLGFHPPSDEAFGCFWNHLTDGDLLMANALTYAAGRSDSVILRASGFCPGFTRFDVHQATPWSTVVFAFAPRQGSFLIPNKAACGGRVFGLSKSARVAGFVTADGTGRATLAVQVPAKACGQLFVQALDRQRCGLSNVLRF